MLFNNQHKFTHRFINNVINKPLLHKKGKQWIVVSTLSLALAGGLGLATSSLTTHADTTNNTNQPVNIMKTAGAVHNTLLTNAAMNTKPSNATQSKRNSSASNTTSSKATSTSSSKASSASSASVKPTSISNSSASTSVNSKNTDSKSTSTSNTSEPKLSLTLSMPDMINTNHQGQSANQGDNNNTTGKPSTSHVQLQQSSTNNPSQQLSDINPAYRQFPFQPQGQDQVDQMNFVYLLNGKPMNANEVPDITHTRTKNSDYSLSKYDENNPYKLYDGTKLYGYDILAHGGTPFSNDFSRYMPKYFNGYKLKKPVFPLNTPQVDMWNSKKIGTEFKGAGTNGITYYLDYTPAKNTIWYHIDNRPSVTALSDVSNGNNGNKTSDYDHNLSDFVNNAKNGKWANLPYSDVKTGYSNGQPIYQKMQDVVVKTDINHRGYSDFFKKVGNNYKYGQSDLESYVPRQFTVDAEPMASITIHFLYNGKDVTTPIVKTGIEHQSFDISDYENDLPAGYNYINPPEKDSDTGKIYSPIDTSTTSDVHKTGTNLPCNTIAFGTVMNGAGKNAGQYTNNKNVYVLLTKNDTDTVSYSYNGKVLPNGWSKSGPINNGYDNDLNNIGNDIADSANNNTAPKYSDLAKNYKYPSHQGFTINYNIRQPISNKLMFSDSYNGYGQTHVIIPLQKVQDTIKYVNAYNGKQVGSTWVHKLTSDMPTDQDSDIQPLGKMLTRISGNNSASDSDYNQLKQTYNYPSNYSLDFSHNLNYQLPSIAQTAKSIPTYQQYVYNPEEEGYVFNQAPKPYYTGKFHLIIPVIPNNPATHTLEYVNSSNNNVVSRYQQTGSDNDIDSDINSNFVNNHVPEYFKIDTSKQQPSVNNIHYDNGVTKIPVKQLTTGINIKYVNLDDVYNPYGQNKSKNYADYYGELGSDNLTNNLQKPNIPFNVLNYNGTNFESAKAINDIAHVNNYQYSQMVSDNNVHQFSDKPQTIVIGLQKVSDNGITYTYNGKPVGSWTSKTQGPTSKDNQEIINLHNNITPFSAPNLPKGYIIPVKSDQNGVSDYSHFTSDDNPLEPNNLDYYRYGQHYTIPVAKDANTITVNYVDKDTGKTIRKAGSDTEKVNAPFDISNYMSNLPSDYNYAGIKNNRTIFGSKNYTVDILLSKNPQGSIKVNYVDKNTHQVLKSTTPVTSNVGTPFDISPYTADSDIPYSYVYDGINNNTQYFNKGTHTVNILLSKLSTVGIHYVDAQTGSDVKDVLLSTSVSGTVINLAQYQHNIPSGYDYVKTQVPTSDGTFNGTAFDNNNHIVTILLHREQGTIQVNYIDKTNGKTVESVQPITGYTNTPFDSNKYTHSLPNGYGYAGINKDVTQFNNGNQVVNIYLNKLGKINIEYIDADSGQTLSTKSDAGPVNTPFDISNYLNNLPDGYSYVRTNAENSQNSNNFDGTLFLDGTNTITVLVNKKPTPKVAKSTITVNYVDSANPNHIISQAGIKTANVSTPFDISEYMDKVPNGYEYAGMKNANPNDDFNGTEFDYNNHTINILLKRVHPTHRTTSTITVNYVNSGKVIASSNDTEPVSDSYDVGSHLNIPKGYEYTGMTSDVDRFGYNNHTITVLVNKTNPAKVAKSKITINYVDKSGNLIQKVGSDTENITTPFDISEYMDKIPNGYEYQGIKNDVDSFDYDNHTVDIVLNKVTPAKVAKSTITVNYMDKNTGKIIKKVGSDTEDITTPFDIGRYLSNLPHNYEYAGINGNVTSFDYDNHTVDILLNKKVVPKSNTKTGSSTASNNSSSATPSTSGNQVKPSSTSNPTSNSSNHSNSSSTKASSGSSATPPSSSKAPSSTSNPVYPNSSATPSSVPSSTPSQASSSSASVPSTSSSASASTPSSIPASSGSSAQPNKSSKHKKLGMIVVQYVGPHHKVISVIKPMIKSIGTKFNSNPYIHMIPKGYRYSGISGNTSSFKAAFHKISILIKKVSVKPVSSNDNKSSAYHRPAKSNHIHKSTESNHTVTPNKHVMTSNMNHMVTKKSQKRNNARKLPQTSENNANALVITLAIIMLGNAFLLSLLDKKHYLN